MNKQTYCRIASTQTAIDNCIKNGNEEWQERHEQKLDELMNGAPSGSGFDSGTKLCMANEKAIIFETSFHHMNQDGYYEGWTDHKITVLPNLSFGFELKVSGKNKNDIKSYIADVFTEWLMQTAE